MKTNPYPPTAPNNKKQHLQTLLDALSGDGDEELAVVVMTWTSLTTSKLSATTLLELQWSKEEQWNYVGV